ncbi:MAG: glycosyltransferase family 2 protein [Gloeobacteraceae cyanobacterium ES-bin-144]|nr:glycosyltransferase family 2 protein [Verrucomicrobiales bacterium]
MNQDFSIIIPFYNEEECARSVLDEIVALYPNAEIIAVDDGSSDRTWQSITACKGVACLRAPVNRGQSSAMFAGLRHATRPVCVLLDGDGQNDPADIPKLLELLSTRDFACGIRVKRKDTAARRYASKIANAIRRAFIHDGVTDTGCSLKAMKRECVEHLVPFNGMHRYIPALLLQAGYTFAEVPVNHRSRHSGQSKYTNWNRALRGIYDLIGVSWLLSRKVRFDMKTKPPTTHE